MISDLLIFSQITLLFIEYRKVIRGSLSAIYFNFLKIFWRNQSNYKIVDSGLFPTDTIYAYFDLSDFLLIYVFFQDVSIWADSVG